MATDIDLKMQLLVREVMDMKLGLRPEIARSVAQSALIRIQTDQQDYMTVAAFNAAVKDELWDRKAQCVREVAAAMESDGSLDEFTARLQPAYESVVGYVLSTDKMPGLIDRLIRDGILTVFDNGQYWSLTMAAQKGSPTERNAAEVSIQEATLQEATLQEAPSMETDATEVSAEDANVVAISVEEPAAVSSPVITSMPTEAVPVPVDADETTPVAKAEKPRNQGRSLADKEIAAVVRLTAEGLSRKEISLKLGISESTVQRRRREARATRSDEKVPESGSRNVTTTQRAEETDVTLGHGSKLDPESDRLNHP